MFGKFMQQQINIVGAWLLMRFGSCGMSWIPSPGIFVQWPYEDFAYFNAINMHINVLCCENQKDIIFGGH